MSGNSSIDEVIKEIKLIEQQIIDIDKQIHIQFEDKKKIQKSIKVIVENVNKLDDKYTKIIDEVIENV